MGSRRTAHRFRLYARTAGAELSALYNAGRRVARYAPDAAGQQQISCLGNKVMMKIESTKRIGFACALVGVALLAGCGGKKTPIPPPPAPMGSGAAPSSGNSSSGQRPVIAS